MTIENIETSANSSRSYFTGLDTIRFYAALAVIVEHIGAQFNPKPDLFTAINLFFIDAQSAVNLFFVLSGFLITYLLLQEHAITSKVNIRKFYLRRILRIWPLYYLIVILGLIIFPLVFGSDYPLTNLSTHNVILAFLLFPNFAQISAPMVHIWSIGVEEQFYATWPWVVRNQKWLLPISLNIIIVKLVMTPIVPLLNSEGALKLFDSLRFECMAIGALGAYVYTKRLPLLRWIYHPATQITTIGIFAFLSVYNQRVSTFRSIYSGLVFISLILNVATNQKSLLKLAHPIGEKLGKISYGLYLYHFPVLYVVFVYMRQTWIANLAGFPILFAICVLGITGGGAVLSYHVFERPFLVYKERLTAL